ncbi:hypothetical protein [Streptomyces sp. NPDC101132]|uniref:hypothetical protein n=1 Tax=Streptomyces sp. NPDC101132 TaxID=3366110 RepID=UPI0037FED319
MRRKVFVTLSSLFTVLLGGFVLVAWVSMPGGGGDVDALTVMAACLGGIAFIRRITGARVVLREALVSVVNPVLTYDVPFRCVAKVEVDSGGTLLITTTQGTEIAAFGFAGSITDHFVGSSSRAVDQIKSWAVERRHQSGGARTGRRYTRAWLADGCAVGMLLCAGLALVNG